TQVVRGGARDRCPAKAASLACQTVPSVGPLMAVALRVLRWSGNTDAESSFVDFLAQHLIPVSREVIADKLSTWSGNVRLDSLGLVGLISIVFLAFVMLNSLEKTINVIWRAEQRRSLAQKFIIFYASVTIGPFLIGTSLYQAAKFGLTDGSSGFLISITASSGAFFLANYVLPATKVRLGPAILGAVV
ncbi:MAG: hypothetical protein GY773_08685, partial [Actinomycetia bacterium]|nr:hypothetical protein [Actinomycetes bacterium]